MSQKSKHLIVLASPSGGGKSTVAKYLLKKFNNLGFSVSATTRAMRPGEINGREYYFLTKKDFQSKIGNGEFVEYEEIFGNLYGTLHSEIDKAIENGEFLVFDIDVKGAFSLKKAYPEETMLIFISPPSLEVLEQRLRNRSTEADEQISTRLMRAEMEMEAAKQFDYIIINDVLDETLKKAENLLITNIL